MSQVSCRRGVPRGAHSRDFSCDDLLEALKTPPTQHVYVELDSGGHVTCAGGGGAARLCVRAGLAPRGAAAGALLQAGALLHAGRRLRLRAAADLAPHADVLLWFAPDALAALDMPQLTPQHVRHAHYACPRCAQAFRDPNPLKVHLFLACADYEPARFWREAVERLRAAARRQTPPAPPLGPAVPAALLPVPELAPAQLEALATEWGRSRGGHVCVYCGKLYSRRYGLKIHLRTHTGYRPLRCRHCLRAFGDPSNLNKHERLHAARGAPAAGRGGPGGRCGGPGAGPHTCPVCGRALARRRDLERHVRTHGGSNETRV
nr:zinc finger protein 775 [Helicoverpa armigera]